MKKTLIATALAVSLPAVAQAGPVWPDVVVHLHGAGKAYLVDTKTDAVAAALDTCKGGTLGSTTPDGKKVYVSCAAEGQKEVVVLDLAGRKVAGRIATGNRPKHAVVSPDGKWLGVNHWGLDDGKLRHSFISTADDRIVQVIDLPVAGQAKGVTSMHNAWSPDSRYFFAVDRVDNRLVVIDTKDWSVKTLPVPSAPPLCRAQSQRQGTVAGARGQHPARLPGPQRHPADPGPGAGGQRAAGHHRV